MPGFARESKSARPAPSIRLAMPSLTLRRPQEARIERVSTSDSGFAPFDCDFGRISVNSRTTVRPQTKLEMTIPGDAFEREADSVANQVMRMSGPQLQRSCACGDKCP